MDITIAGNLAGKGIAMKEKMLPNGYVELTMEAFGISEGFETIKTSPYLTKRQKFIILEHYQNNKTYTEIGNEMHLTRERIRQIASGAMDGVRITLAWACMSSAKKQEYKQRIDFKGLSVRSRNALMRNHLSTPEEVMKYLQKNKDMEPEEALRRIKNVGEKTAQEICKFLKRKRLYIPTMPEFENMEKSA